MPTFLDNLTAASQSTIALVAYLAVVMAWFLRFWVGGRPQRKAKEILSLYSSDAERTRALGSLLGNEPPSGLKKEEILAWVALQGKHQSRSMLIVAYLATLFAVIVIIGMALFFPQHLEASRPPVLIDSTVLRPDPR